MNLDCLLEPSLTGLPLESGSRPEDVRILVVCLASQEQKASEIIAKHAPVDWQAIGAVRVLSVKDRFRRFKSELARKIDEVARPSRATRVLVLAPLEPPTKVDFKDVRIFEAISSLKRFARVASPILRQSGTDWFTHAVDNLKGWQHGEITRNHVESWLRNFELAGNQRWIGERLLRGFDFWSSHRWLSTLNLEPTILVDFDKVCVNRHRPGKSADALANLVTKRLRAMRIGNLEVSDFYETLENGVPGTRIIYIEDGLFSGTETLSLFNSLLGRVPPDRKPKVPPLTDSKNLWDNKIHLVFPTATTLGIARLEDFLDANGLSNITFEVSPFGRVEVFTPDGRDAFLRQAFFADRNLPADPSNHLIVQTFQNSIFWVDDRQREVAIEYCRSVGDQLFRNYLGWMNYKWPEEKIRPCALGMFGLGLNLGFAHSIPKATLPLFWMGGKVSYGGKKVRWTPLFPNAA